MIAHTSLNTNKFIWLAYKLRQAYNQVYMSLSKVQQQEIHKIVVTYAKPIARRWQVPLEDVVQQGWEEALTLLKKYDGRAPLKNFLAFCLHRHLSEYAAVSRTIVQIPKANSVAVCTQLGQRLSTWSNVDAERVDNSSIESWVRLDQALKVCEEVIGEGACDAIRNHVLTDAKIPAQFRRKICQFRKGKLSRRLTQKLRNI